MRPLSKNIISLHGDKGKAWLNALPQFLEEMENKLNIKIEKPLEKLTFNYVAYAKANGADYIFKCNIPSDEFSGEINALKYFNGCGAITLFSADENMGWMLLEKCVPGIAIAALQDDDATRIAVQTMQALWKPINNHDHLKFKTTRDWLQGLQRAEKLTLPVSKKLIQRAIVMSDELLLSSGEAVLLHGDLHHDNILSSQRSKFLAIDPKGIVGEREYDIGALMRNPYRIISNDINLEKLFNRRLDIITELTAFNRERLLQWSFVQAVLAAVWHCEDGTKGMDEMVRVAVVLSGLL